MPMFRPRRAILLGGLASTAFLAASVAGAPAASVQSVSAAPYALPAGDRVEGAMSGPAAPAARLVPAGEAALLRIKDAAAGQGGATAGGIVSAPVAEAAQPRTVQPGSKKFVARTCRTNKSTGSAPADVQGAAGNDNLVVVTNSDIGVYNKKNCKLVSRVPLADFFAAAGVPATATLLDPRVLYDTRSKRFFVTAVSRDSGNDDQYQYLAVSRNGTGTTYHLYRIVLSEGGTKFCKIRPADVWDYPMSGASKGRWYISANVFRPNGSARGAILSIDKAATLSGANARLKCFDRLAPNLAPPVVLGNATFGVFLSPGGSGGGDELVRVRVNERKAGPQKDERVILPKVGIPLWSAAPNAPQPNGQLLDTLDGRFQSASMQTRELIWNVHTVSFQNSAKVRIYRLSTSPDISTLSLVFQPTTVLPPEKDFLFNASLATSSGRANAPLFLTASRTIPGQAAGRAAHLMFQGLNNSADSAKWRFKAIATSKKEMTGCNSRPTGACRWGEYSATQIDPNQGTANRPRAWGFNQIVGGPAPVGESDWDTRAGQVTTLVVR